MTKPGTNLYVPYKWQLNWTLCQLNTQDIYIFCTVPSWFGWWRICPATKTQTRNNDRRFWDWPYKVIFPTCCKTSHILVTQSFPKPPILIYRFGKTSQRELGHEVQIQAHAYSSLENCSECWPIRGWGMALICRRPNLIVKENKENIVVLEREK